ncbi:unnamed protein product [Urochloa humidicola]
MSSPSPSSPGIQAPPLRQQPQEHPPLLLPPKKRWAWLARNAPEDAAFVPTDSPPAVVAEIHATPASAAVNVNPLPPPATTTPSAPRATAGQKRSSPMQPLAGDHKPGANAPPAAAKRKPKQVVVRRVRKFAVRTKVFGPQGNHGRGGGGRSGGRRRRRTIAAAGGGGGGGGGRRGGCAGTRRI